MRTFRIIISIADIIDSKTYQERRTPVSNSDCLFVASIEHGADDHKPGCNGSLARAKDKTDNKQPGKVLAGSVRAKGDTPDEDVAAV